MMRERMDARCGFAEAGQTPELKKRLSESKATFVCDWRLSRIQSGCEYVSINDTSDGR